MIIDELNNFHRTSAKFIVTLDAILEGIYCDVSMNQDELLFLDTWLLELNSSTPLNDQAKYIYKITKSFTESFLSIPKSELSSIILDEYLTKLEQIQDKIKIESMPFICSVYTKREYLVNYLQGLCKGLIADGSVANSEIECLSAFLSDNPEIKSDPVFHSFYSLISDVNINNKEQIEIVKRLIIDYSGTTIDGIVDGGCLGESFFDYVKELNLDGKVVQFTGKFITGSRKKCKEIAESQGAIVLDDWRSDIDYLIVGSSSSRDWMYQSYGRKIELAKKWQVERNHKVKIITEDNWLK